MTMNKKMMLRMAAAGAAVLLIFFLLFATLVTTIQEAYIAAWKKTEASSQDGTATGDEIVAYALQFANKTPMYRYLLG